MALLSQYLPDQYQAIRDGRLRNLPGDILNEGVAKVLRQYLHASGASAPTLESTQ